MSARSIFEARIPGTAHANWTTYHGRLRVHDKLIGGIPKDPDTIAKWIASRMEMDDRALLELVQTTAMEMEADRDEAITRLQSEIAVLDVRILARETDRGEPLDEDALTALKTRKAKLEEELEQVAPRPSGDELVHEVAKRMESGNGFKLAEFDGQLVVVYEGRCLKACLKEAVNVGYPGTNFLSKKQIGSPDEKGVIRPAGQYRKGLMSTLAERVFIPELVIPMRDDQGRLITQVSGTEQRIKHVVTAQGPRSAINVVDYVEHPVLDFTVEVLDDFLTVAEWLRVWELAERIGIGADRARSDGKFELLAFDKVEG